MNPSWMKLVSSISWNFPGLETAEKLKEHENTVLRFISEGRALCVKKENVVVGVLLFSKKHNMICCLAVAPDYRRHGIASALLSKAIEMLDRTRDINVSTFRENDLKGTAPCPGPSTTIQCIPLLRASSYTHTVSSPRVSRPGVRIIRGAFSPATGER